MLLTSARLTLLLLFLAGASSATAEAADQAAEQAAPAQFAATDAVLARLLQKRRCVSNGCRCDSRGQQFHSCGNCKWTDTNTWVVTRKRASGDIFECGPGGVCCSYGPADDCGTNHARCGATD